MMKEIMIKETVRQTALVHVFATAVLAGACLSFGTRSQAINCLFGGILIGLNLAIIAWTFGKIIQKKSVGLAVTVIVMKYAVLIGLFILLYLMEWQIDFGFVLGLSTMLPTLGFLAYRHLQHASEL